MTSTVRKYFAAFNRMELPLAVVLALCSLAAHGTNAFGQDSNVMARMAFRIDLPKDEGLPIGTLFEIKNSTGQRAAGAGFTYTNNMNQLSNPRVLSFYIKGRSNTIRITNLGKPFGEEDKPLLFNFKSDLIALPYLSQGHRPKRFDKNTGRWSDIAVPRWNDLSGIMSIQVVDGKLLLLYHDVPHIYYDGVEIIGDPRWRDKFFIDHHFSRNKLYVLSTTRSIWSGARDGVIVAYVCAWVPGDMRATDCMELDLQKYGVEFTMFPESDRDGIIYAGHLGDVLKLSAVGTEALRESDSNSYQIYSALRYSNCYLLGQYPTGNLMNFCHDALGGFIDPPIGHQSCSSENAREVGSLSVYGGQIVAGLWPWGELWAGEPGKSWSLVRRLFDSPSPCGEVPYLDRLQGADGMNKNALGQANALGQRIFSIANWSTGIAASTSIKESYLAKAMSVLTPEERSPYGSVFLIEKDHEIACELTGSGIMQLAFIVRQDSISIEKDGTTICSKPVTRGSIGELDGSVTVGSGLYGSFAGQILSDDFRRTRD